MFKSKTDKQLQQNVSKPNREMASWKKGTYSSYKSMIERCHDWKSKAYKDYGDKGVKVCSRWRDSFAAFIEDMGLRPDGTTIDRIDNSKGYEPSNCRWATWIEQANNRTNNIAEDLKKRVIELRTEGYSYEVIARMTMISRGSAHIMIKKLGYDPLIKPKPAPFWLDMKKVHKARKGLAISNAKRRNVVRLRTLGHSFREIASKVGISEDSVRRIIYCLEHDPIVRPVWKGKAKEFLEGISSNQGTEDITSHD